MSSLNLKKYQKDVLKANQTYSPSKINLKRHKEKYFSNLEDLFFDKLFLNRDYFKNKNILDLGCGTGETDIFFKKAGAKSVIGVDFNQKSIDQANIYKKKNNLKNIKFICGDILKFSPKKKIDLVVCKGVLAHISNKDRVKLFKKIQKYPLSKGAKIILGFLDSGGNLIKLFQQIIINDLFKEKTDLEKFKYAKNLFKSNFKRFKKHGFREPIQVFYDYFVNQRSYGLSHMKVLNNFESFTLVGSYPYNLQLINSLPVNFKSKKITDYNYFLFQQMHWFNNTQIKIAKKNENLLENYENSLANKNLKNINKKNIQLKNKLKNLKKTFLLNFENTSKDFFEFNNLVNFVLNVKNPVKVKINKILKSKFFKRFCGMSTTYIVLKKD